MWPQFNGLDLVEPKFILYMPLMRSGTRVWTCITELQLKRLNWLSSLNILTQKEVIISNHKSLWYAVWEFLVSFFPNSFLMFFKEDMLGVTIISHLKHKWKKQTRNGLILKCIIVMISMLWSWKWMTCTHEY
jgi:hypothetical protein